MPSSSKIIAKQDATAKVLGFEPANFTKLISEDAQEFVSRDEGFKETAFKIDSVVAEQSGVAEIKRINRQKLVEEEALKVVKVVEEKAYQEAYRIGLEEGKKKAHEDYSGKIEFQLDNLSKVINEIENLKIDLLKQNEKHIVDLCFYLAKRLLLKELSVSKESMLIIVKKLIENAQSEEEITLRVSTSDKEFLKQNVTTLAKRDVISKIKIEESPELSAGSIILETNYGIVDASIEQRIDKLKTILDDIKPV